MSFAVVRIIEAHLIRRLTRSAIAAIGMGMAAGCGRALSDPGRPSQKQEVRAPDGVRIVYETWRRDSADEPALVFVHGWSCDRTYWTAQLVPFAKDFDVVAVDLAGHGESGRGREAWTIEAFGHDVAATVRALPHARVILIGHSMGGDVIVAAARQLPGRISGLVWVDTYSKLGTPHNPERVQAFVAKLRANFVEETRGLVRGMFPAQADRALVERVALDMSSAPPEIAVAAVESALRYNDEIPQALRELQLPVVAINPDYRANDIASLKQHGVETVVMPGVGHFLMMEDPDRFNAFLRRVIDHLIHSSAGPDRTEKRK